MLSIFCSDTGLGIPLLFGAASRGGCAIEEGETVDPTIEPALLYVAGGSGSVASGVPLACKNFDFDLSFSSDLPILEAPEEYPEIMLSEAFDEPPLASRKPDFWCARGRGLDGGTGDDLTSLA